MLLFSAIRIGKIPASITSSLYNFCYFKARFSTRKIGLMCKWLSANGFRLLLVLYANIVRYSC